MDYLCLTYCSNKLEWLSPYYGLERSSVNIMMMDGSSM